MGVKEIVTSHEPPPVQRSAVVMRKPGRMMVGASAQIVPNLGEKREEASGRQCTKRSAVTACAPSGYHRKFSAISHLQKRVAPNSNPCLPANLKSFQHNQIAPTLDFGAIAP